MNRPYQYDVIAGSDLTESDCEALSRLFSESYGRWSARSPYHPGDPIRLPPAKYRDWYARGSFKIARCRQDGHLVGQAVYLDVITSRGPVAFVVQLVVDTAHRHKGIATALLHSAFGFSDSYAWAIVTSSPCTIAALESATFRRGNPERIRCDASFIRDELFARIEFLSGVEPDVSTDHSRVNTRFFTDRSSVQPDGAHVAARYGALPEGQEWLAVVFRDQQPDCLERYSDVIACSGEIVADAFRRMPQHAQRWAAETDSEVDEMLRCIPELSKADPVCDFGAGSGRHVSALKARGFTNVTGIDFAVSESGRAAGIVEADCRDWRSGRPCRFILCLYDVIGSFADDEQNKRILANIAENLAEDGVAVLSVANAAYSGKCNIHSIDATDHAQLVRAVFALSPSNAMATDGEFFAHESLWDEKSGLFFHKEQFRNGSIGLPAEYLVVDRRYVIEEIVALAESVGLHVVQRRFVRAGFSRDFTVSTGKEIFLVCTSSKGITTDTKVSL